MMTSLHLRVSRGLSVSHTRQSITRNTLLLPNLAKNNQPTHYPWLILAHQLRPSVMLKKTRQQETSFFRSWWPFSSLLSLISLDDVFCPLPNRSPWQNVGRNNDRKHENKNKEMKRVKVIFCHEKLKNNWSKETRKKTIGKTEGLLLKKAERKKKREMAWCNGCPAAESNDNWVHIRPNSLNNVTRRSNDEESLQSCMRSSTRVN